MPWSSLLLIERLCPYILFKFRFELRIQFLSNICCKDITFSYLESIVHTIFEYADPLADRSFSEGLGIDCTDDQQVNHILNGHISSLRKKSLITNLDFFLIFRNTLFFLFLINVYKIKICPM